MNKSVEKPTKVIIINMEPKTNDSRGQEEYNQDLSIKDQLPLQNTTELEQNMLFHKENSKLNFYEMNSEITQNIQVENNMLLNDLHEIIKSKSTFRDKTTQFLDTEFMTTSIKYDIRVRETRNSKDEIQVYFYTVEEAVSFYHQYFKLVHMRFREDYDNFLFSDSISITQVQKSKDIPFKFFSPTGTEQIQNIEENKPFEQCYSEPKTQSEFEARVSYFNKMKNMYSKNEIKKVSSFIESGNLDFILINIKELCVGSASNILIQNMLKGLSNENLLKMIKALGNDISAISSTKYGAYTIQTLIMSCYSKDARNLLVECFGEQGKFLLCHEIGNYTIQRILLFDEEYVYNLFKETLIETVRNELGIKVLKRCLEHLKSKIDLLKEELVRLNFKEGNDLLAELNE